jgi:hypothetical protein
MMELPFTQDLATLTEPAFEPDRGACRRTQMALRARRDGADRQVRKPGRVEACTRENEERWLVRGGRGAAYEARRRRRAQDRCDSPLGEREADAQVLDGRDPVTADPVQKRLRGVGHSFARDAHGASSSSRRFLASPIERHWAGVSACR